MAIKMEALREYKEYCGWVDSKCIEMLKEGFADCCKYKCVTCKPKFSFDYFYKECYLDDKMRKYARDKGDIDFDRIDDLFLDHIYRGIIKRKSKVIRRRNKNVI